MEWEKIIGAEAGCFRGKCGRSKEEHGHREKASDLVVAFAAHWQGHRLH